MAVQLPAQLRVVVEMESQCCDIGQAWETTQVVGITCKSEAILILIAKHRYTSTQ